MRRAAVRRTPWPGCRHDAAPARRISRSRTGPASDRATNWPRIYEKIKDEDDQLEAKRKKVNLHATSPST